MKSTYSLALTATSILLVSTAPLRATETDDRIESSAKKSYVFKTYLKDDSIKTESKNGAVTLTGTVAEASHKSLAENTVASLPGVKSVDNQLKIKGENPAGTFGRVDQHESEIRAVVPSQRESHQDRCERQRRRRHPER